MNKLTDQYQDIKVFNDYQFSVDGNLFISYTPCDHSRGGHGGAYWAVVKPGEKTHPNGPWYCYGNRHFTRFAYGESRTHALEAAKEWAGEKYGISEWARTPFGAWMDAGFVKKRMAELKRQLEVKAA